MAAASPSCAARARAPQRRRGGGLQFFGVLTPPGPKGAGADASLSKLGPSRAALRPLNPSRPDRTPLGSTLPLL